MRHNDALCMENFWKESYALPFGNNKSSLPNNEWIALKRTRILQRAFLKDKNYGLLYVAQIEKLLILDFLEVLPGTEVGNIIHYLPFFFHKIVLTLIVQ